MTTIPSQDRYLGCVLGLAIGDALGWPVEFLRLSAIRAQFGADGITDLHPSQRHPRGTFTDDTQMSLALARAILSHGTQSEAEFVAESARQFVLWSQSAENDRAPGMTCMAGCRALAKDPNWRAPGNNDSKGCGTAMRTAPIGLAWHGDEDKITRMAAQTSELTHGHPAATAGGVATALLVSWALDGMPPDDMLRRLVERTRPISGEFADKVLQVPMVLHRDSKAAYGVLGGAWTADEATACALYAFMQSPSDYRQTVITAVNMDGDSDSVGCIAGAISGAFNGVAAIPETWRQDVEQRETLIEIAGDLHAFAKG
ncbi:MAG: ADP-ribosylglycohydrolase family protein [Planctomycetes bacterium]|nr:ADP-ribosylglycohydrolase family protein [Planctomycetota bacterium]